jgi:hypothetical protein
MNLNQSTLYESYGLDDGASLVGKIPTYKAVPKTFNPDTIQAYPFTTENMTDYMPHIDLAGQDVLAICGSNDFALNAFMKGAKRVDAVDLMRGACLYGELKAAGLSGLSRAEFIRFFNHATTDGYFNEDTYHEKMRDSLSDQATAFFDLYVDPKHKKLVKTGGFFINKISMYTTLRDNRFFIGMNPYLKDDDSFDTAKNNVGEVAYHPTDMNSFIDKSEKGKYDTVYFSNIFSYMDEEVAIKTIRTAADKIKSGGSILTFSFLGQEGRAHELQDFYSEGLEGMGLSATSIINSVPHMDKYEQGHSSVLIAFRK